MMKSRVSENFDFMVFISITALFLTKPVVKDQTVLVVLAFMTEISLPARKKHHRVVTISGGI